MGIGVQEAAKIATDFTARQAARHEKIALSVILLTLGVACGCNRKNDSAKERAERHSIIAVIDRDQAYRSLREADEFVLDKRPILAAELLIAAAIPATNRVADDLDRLSLETGAGRTARARLAACYRARSRALAGYAQVLSRGNVEDLILVRALDAQRRADQDLQSELLSLSQLGREGKKRKPE